MYYLFVFILFSAPMDKSFLFCVSWCFRILLFIKDHVLSFRKKISLKSGGESFKEFIIVGLVRGRKSICFTIKLHPQDWPCVERVKLKSCLGFFGLMNVYFCRINLSMAVVEMVGSSSKATNSTDQCPVNQTIG